MILRWAHVVKALDRPAMASIVALIGTVVALLGVAVAVISFEGSLRQQRDAQAVELFRGYLVLSQEPGMAGYEDPQQPDSLLCSPAYQRFASYALFVGESIYDLEGGDSAWTHTVESILDAHARFIGSELFPLDEYSPRFRRLVLAIDDSAGKRPACESRPPSRRRHVKLISP